MALSPSAFTYCVLAFTVIISACAQPTRLHNASDCAQSLADLEDQAAKNAIFLSDPRAVENFPALGSSRFLASFNPAAMTDEQRSDWWQRLLAAGDRRRNLLIDMLNAQSLTPPVGGKERTGLDRCARQAASALLRGDVPQDALHQSLQVADDYSLWRRIMGVYPLTSLAAGSGVRSLQSELRASFELSPDAIPVAGIPRVYRPQTYPLPSASNALPDRLPRDSLGARLPDKELLAALLHKHAPLWHLNQQGGFDRPGAPYIAPGDLPRVDTSHPVVFTFASLTRVESVAHLQLNYLMWFNARPKEQTFDTLGGRLDGLLWRVTLDKDGEVLLYDSVHACGCYQLFFPGSGLTQKAATQDWPEPPLVMQTAPALAPGERPVLWVSSKTHYLQGLSVSDGDSEQSSQNFYQLEDYKVLYFVDHPSGSRSLFDRHGIVAGTQRGERFYLWPMGIRSPGAMRERGRHATAFIGRRHFDDADLIDQIFRVAD